jgi:diguanylate cyclase (GGDEF)-like protein
MKKIHIIYLEITALVIVFIWSCFFVPLTPDIKASGLGDCTLYNDGWSVSYNTDSQDEVWLTKTITKTQEGKSIGFFSLHQLVSVYIDDELVYEFIPPDGVKSLTPGNRWNFIRLDDSKDSCEMSIHLTECYSTSNVNIPDIYYGTQAGMLLTYLKSESGHILVSCLMITFGLLIFVFYFPSRKKIDYKGGIIWLALFSFFRGMWTLIESNVYSFFFVRILFLSQLSYIALKISAVAFTEFANLAFHNGRSKVLSIMTIIEFVDFCVSTICQYIFGIDYAYTVYATYLILTIVGVYTCIHSIIMFQKSKPLEASLDSSESIVMRNAYGVHALSTLLIVVASYVDIIRYYLFRSPDAACFSTWTSFIYIALISVTLFANFATLLKMEHNAKQLKEAATTDPLTKLKNRSSFERDITSGTQLEWLSTGIVMLDLNNLKHFNDVHGHSMGDYYIIISSEIICDAFSKYGTVYRIGGDEFCVIAKNLSMDNFISVRTSIEDYMSALKMPSSDLHMGISAGFAEFNANIDLNLKDTMKRADEYMYQRKLELKKQNHRE